MKRKTKGIMLGVLGAACYGTNPLFALPLYASGLQVNSVLFYRYFFAIILFGLWLVFVKKISLKISKKEAGVLLPLGILFALSSLTLFLSYNYIDAGIASTILFIYPIMVALIMTLVFKEKISHKTVVAILLTTIGIGLLYKGKDGTTLDLFGIVLVLLSSLCYAVYIVTVKKNATLKHIKYSKLTFYVMLFGILVFIFNFMFTSPLQAVNTPLLWLCTLALAVFPTIVSLETMTIAIKLIGPTLSAILGALEPVTAIFFGVLLFHEQLTPRICAGIVLILFSVLLIIVDKKHS